MKGMAVLILAPALVAVLAGSSSAGGLSYWNLDEISSPYANGGGSGGALSQDTGTDTAGSGAGILGNAVHLQYTDGPSTRITSASDPQSGNSFGFSFFANPQYISNGDMFFTAEALGGSISRAFDYWDWTVRAVTVGSGLGLEFIVRGQGGAGTGEGYAALTSSEIILNGGGQEGHWWHIAGGYDAVTGDISFYTRDMTDDLSATEYTGTGDSGMTTHGAGVSLGTVDYNGSYVNFAANTYMDEVRLYDAPLSAQDVAGIEAAIPEPATGLLVGAGGLVLAWARRRRQP